MAAKHYLAVDLGTYNSAAAVLTPGGEIQTITADAAECCRRHRDESVKPFPSVVVYHADGTVRAVGEAAKALARREPGRAIWGVKRLLGKTYKEALDHGELGRMVITVEPDQETGRCMFMLEDKDLRPEDVCADLLRHIRSAAEGQIGADLTHAVISVPAYFDAIAIGATVSAARLAGFESVETIPEPAAAALASDRPVTPRPVNFLVFDLGAGTLDVTAAEVLRARPGPSGLECRCLKHTGATHLGGLDMDDRLLALLTERMGLVNLDPEDRAVLRHAAESAKIELTSRAETLVGVGLKSRELSYTLTRFEMEQTIEELIQACRDQVLAALQGAHWSPTQVERLLLIGGPVVMPCVVRMLKSVFWTNPSVLQQINAFDSSFTAMPEDGPGDRMLAVSVGAARSKASRMVRVHPYGYGYVQLRLESDRPPQTRLFREPRILLPRDSGYPSEPVTEFYTPPFYSLDHVFSLEVLQEVPDAEQEVPGLGQRPYRFLGEFRLAFAHPPHQVQVSMRLNECGELETAIVNVSGTDVATYVGVPATMQVPIELPSSHLKEFGSSDTVAVFVAGRAEKLLEWGVGFGRFLTARVGTARVVDGFIVEKLRSLDAVLANFQVCPAKGAADLFSTSNPLLERARSLRLITEAEYQGYWGQLRTLHRLCHVWETRSAV